MNRTGLYRRRWTLPEPRGTIVLVHGLGEHCGRYDYAAQSLNARGYDVISGDLPGHGRSPGIRGHIDAFDDYLDVVDDWVTEAHSRAKERPVFLLGHSVGGLIAIRFLETRQPAEALAGAVLSSPALRVKYPIPAWKSALGTWLDRISPRLCLSSGLKGQRVTRNEDVIRARSDDPLMVHVASVRLYKEMLRAQPAALQQADRIHLPVLLLHGEADEIIEPSVSIEFGERLSSSDKLVRLLSGLHHEIMNEPEREDVLKDISDWLDRHSPPGAM